MLLLLTVAPDTQAQRRRYADTWVVGPGVVLAWDESTRNLTVGDTWNVVAQSGYGLLCDPETGHLRRTSANGIVRTEGGRALDVLRASITPDFTVTENTLILPHPGNVSLMLIVETRPLVATGLPPPQPSARLQDSIVIAVARDGRDALDSRAEPIFSGRDLPSTLPLSQPAIGHTVTATTTCDGTGYWILTTQRPAFVSDELRVLAWKFDADGLAAEPVISTVPIMGTNWGHLCPTPDGERLLVSLSVTEFDKATGVVRTTATALPDSVFSSGHRDVAFTHDGRYVYHSQLRQRPGEAEYALVITRYDTEHVDADARFVEAGRWAIPQVDVSTSEPTPGFRPVASIGLAPDSAVYVTGVGRVYRLRRPWLPVADIVIDTVAVADTPYAALILPNVVTAWFVPPAEACQPPRAMVTIDTVCADSCVTVVYTGSPYDTLVAEIDGGSVARWSTTRSPCLDLPDRPVRLRLVVRNRWGSDTLVRTVLVRRRPIVDAGRDTTVCSGAVVRLAATSGYTSYRWTPAGGLDDPTSRTPLVTIGKAAGVWYVRAWNADGCEGLDSVTIDVHDDATTVSSDTTICRGGAAPLRASGGRTYRWSPAAGLSSTSSEAVIAAPDTTTIYHVLIADSNGCTWDRSVTVVVRTSLAVDAGPDVIACGGATVHLQASGTGDAVWSWSWDPVDGLDAPATANPSFVFDGTERRFVVTAVAPDGCTGSDTVIVRPGVLEASVIGDTAVCRGTSVDLLAVPAGATYRWLDLGAPSFDPRRPVAPPTSTTYAVEVTSGSCVDTAYHRVTVREPPVLVVTSDTVVCRGASVLLTATGATVYRWRPADGVSDTTSPSPFVMPATTTTYMVIGRNADGCADTALVHVQVVDAVVVEVSDDTTICMGDTAEIAVRGGRRYRVEPDQGVIAVTADHILLAPRRTTTYAVIGSMADGGCADTATVTVTVVEATLPGVPADTTICAGDTVWVDLGATSAVVVVPATGVVERGGRIVGLAPERSVVYAIRSTDGGRCPAHATVSIVVTDQDSRGRIVFGGGTVRPGATTTTTMDVVGMAENALITMPSPAPMATLTGIDRGTVVDDGRLGGPVVIRLSGDGQYALTWYGYLAARTSAGLTVVGDSGVECRHPFVVPGELTLEGCGIPFRAIRLTSGMGSVGLYDLQGRGVAMIPTGADGSLAELMPELAAGVYLMRTEYAGSRLVVVDGR